MGCRTGGRGRARSAQLLPFGEAQLTCGYGNLTGNWMYAGGSPHSVGYCASQLSTSRAKVGKQVKVSAHVLLDWGNCALHPERSKWPPTVVWFALHAVVVREHIRDALYVLGLSAREHLYPRMRAEYGHDVDLLRELHDNIAALLAMGVDLQIRAPYTYESREKLVRVRDVPCSQHRCNPPHIPCSA